MPPPQFEITGNQAVALAALLDEQNDGESAVVFTMQEDGSLTVSFSLGLFTIKTDGDVVE